MKQKLLEHVAAALCVENCEHPPLERGMATPPATPERRKRSGKEYDMESITIYALLADVQQEIDRPSRPN